MPRQKKLKVKVIDSKIKKIKTLNSDGTHAVEPNLEENIEKEEEGQFSQFMSSGQSVTPVLRTGQRPEPIETIVPERTPRPQNQNAGGMIKPEFSVYEAVRRFDNSVQGTRYAPNRNTGDPTTQIRINPGRNEDSNRLDFANPELQRLRGENQEKYDYNVKISSEENKGKRRQGWEG